MKILHIIPTLCKGGAERLVIDIVNELSRRKDISIRLVVLHNVVDYDISAIKDLIHHIPAKLQLSLLRKIKFKIDTLQQFLEDFQPDIIHTHLFEAEIVSRSCLFPKAKWYSHVHDNMSQLANFRFSSILSKDKFLRLFEKKYLLKRYKINCGSQFVAISNHTESYIKSVQNKFPVILQHNAINFCRFIRPENHFKSKNDFIKIINIGSFVPKKNQSFLVEVISNLKEKGVKTKIYFLGDGPTRHEVTKKAIQFGVMDSCFFEGNVENVEKYLWDSDIYIHSAKYEPLGLVILEAMAAGLPVITLDGGGNRDLIEEGKNGFLIEEANADLFVEKIMFMIEYKSSYQAVSTYAIEFAKNYDIKNYVDKLLTQYKT